MESVKNVSTQKITENAPLRIKISDEIATGLYCNTVIIKKSETEFVFDFIQAHPGEPHATVVSRVILPPVQTKRFVMATTHHLRDFEAHFGAIETEISPGE
jgi:hypothetical protein